MSARADILSRKFIDSPTGKEALRKAGAATDEAKLFASFVGYAAATWSYAAQPGGLTAKALLDGDGPKTAACGTVREALKLMMRDDLKLTVTNADINYYFLTKPDLKCFDAKVKGNVGNHGKTTFDLACHFSTHYFIKSGAKFYDPCLMAVYNDEKGPIAHLTKPIAGPPGLKKAGTGRAIIILHLLVGRSVPGFGSVWEILQPGECKKALNPAEYTAVKNDPDVKAAKLL